MNMYSELLEELMDAKKKFFVADSIDAPETIGYTQDELSQVISESIELTPNLFAEMCEVIEEHNDIPHPQMGYCEGEDMAWVFDDQQAMYYFYR